MTCDFVRAQPSTAIDGPQGFRLHLQSFHPTHCVVFQALFRKVPHAWIAKSHLTMVRFEVYIGDAEKKKTFKEIL